MRRLLILSLLMLAAVPFVSAALDPSQYLYEEEGASAIATTSFTLASSTSAYQLVSISGTPSFLLKDGSPITDAAAAEAVLREYYSKTAYLSSSELSDLKAEVLSFNASRDYKTSFGPAESTCKQAIGLTTIPCSSLSGCTQTATMVCYLYGEGSGCDPSVLGAYTYDYQKNVGDLDTRMAAAMAALDSITFDSASSKLDTIQLALNGAKDAAAKVKTSKLRFPSPGESCPDCLGACPSTKFDTASLDAAIASVGTYKARVAPLKDIHLTATNLVTAQNDRMAYKLNTALTELYGAKFDQLKNKTGNISEEAELAGMTVADEQYDAILQRFRSAKAKIETSLSLKDFRGINESLAAYESTAAQLQEAIDSNFTKPYTQLEDAQDQANDKLLAASWGLDKTDSARLDAFTALASRKNQIDATFEPPMTADQYAQLSTAYIQLASDTQTFTESGKNAQKTMLGVGTSIGQKSVDGAMAITAMMTPVNFQTRQKIAPYIPPAVLMLTDLSLLSIALIAFVGGLIYFRGVFSHKLVLGAWVLGLIAFSGFLLIGTVAFYYGILNQSSQMASFSEFYSQVQAAPSSSVIADISAATAGGVVAMDNCSQQLEAQLHTMNKTVRLFTINGDTCQFQNVTNETTETVNLAASDCLGMIADEPVFYLKYAGENQTPQFSVVVQKQATVSGDEQYHARCDIANVLG